MCVFVSTGELFNSCSCRDDRTIFIHESWADLEEAAHCYETDDGVVAEVLNAPAISDSFVVDLSPVSFEGREMQIDKCPTVQSKFPNETSSAQLEPLSFHNQHQEGESEPEAFMVKRRRVFPHTWRRFQVDERGLSTKKSMVWFIYLCF
jgi:hypothetical protein